MQQEPSLCVQILLTPNVPHVVPAPAKNPVQPPSVLIPHVFPLQHAPVIP